MVDIIIAVALFSSVIIGFLRGIVRESIAIAGLFLAIWAAMRFGGTAGAWFDASVGSTEVQLWSGRALVFIVILAIGALAGWGISKIVRMAGLSGIDRAFGAFFGIIRAILILGLFVLTGRFAGFYDYDWWHDSKIIPVGEQVADWIQVMAPKGLEMIQPENLPDELAF